MGPECRYVCGPTSAYLGLWVLVGLSQALLSSRGKAIRGDGGLEEAEETYKCMCDYSREVGYPPLTHTMGILVSCTYYIYIQIYIYIYTYMYIYNIHVCIYV